MCKPHHLANPCLIVFLASAYFLVVYVFTTNFPIDDDFYLLALVNKYADGYPIGFEQLLALHNEHRIAITRLVFISSYELFGGVNFRFLSLLANLSILGIFLLCCLRLPGKVGFGSVGLVIAALLFQYGSAESMLWPVAALSNYFVLLLMLLGMVALERPGLRNLGLAVLLSLLAVVTQGNGLLVPYTMALYLLFERRYASFVTLLVVSMAVSIAYISPSQSDFSGDSLLSWLGMLPIKLLFSLSFLGNAFGIGGSNFPVISGLSMMLTTSIGVLTVGLTTYALCCHRKRSVNLLASINIFLILTALVVAESRIHFGLAQSLISRYHINSALSVVTTILLCREMFPSHWFWKRMEQSYWTIIMSLIYVLGTSVFVVFFYMNIFMPARENKVISANPEWARQQLQESIERGIFTPESLR